MRSSWIGEFYIGQRPVLLEYSVEYSYHCFMYFSSRYVQEILDNMICSFYRLRVFHFFLDLMVPDSLNVDWIVIPFSATVPLSGHIHLHTGCVELNLATFWHTFF